MEKETLDTLEYDKIRAMLEAKAGSVLGKEKARAVLPSGDFAEVEELLRETEEAVRLSASSTSASLWQRPSAAPCSTSAILPIF